MVSADFIPGVGITLLTLSDSDSSSGKNGTNTEDSHSDFPYSVLCVLIPLVIIFVAIVMFYLFTCKCSTIGFCLRRLCCYCCSLCYGYLKFSPFCDHNRNPETYDEFVDRVENNEAQQVLNFKTTGNIKNPYYKRFNKDIPYLPQRKDEQSQVNDPVDTLEMETVKNMKIELQSKDDYCYENDLGNQYPMEV